MALSFLAAFLWSVRKGQYNDTYTPSIRILLEDAPKKNQNLSENKISNKNEI